MAGSVLHMNVGEGENSYAANSSLTRMVISKSMPHIRKTLTELYRKTLPKCLTFADMGCSSGPNTFMVISEIINTVESMCTTPLPEFQVFLNDLPGNDFNNIFKSTPSYYEKLRRDKGDDFPRCYITGVPGSFFGRLFPTNTLMFVHSCYGVHWLSQGPEVIRNTNKGNIYIAKTSPHSVCEAYKQQFDQDFSAFLRSRSEEVISGGRMVITVVGRRSPDPSSDECCRLWELISESLRDLVKLGMTEDSKLDSFNMPLYASSGMELRSMVQNEGSFQLDSLEAFDVNWDPADDPENEEFVFDKKKSATTVAKIIRAAMEPMLARHFGTEIIDDLFQIFTEKVGDQLAKEKIKHVSWVMCMTKKDATG